MVNMRTCETVATQASHTLGISNAVYVPGSNMHCVLRWVWGTGWRKSYYSTVGSTI